MKWVRILQVGPGNVLQVEPRIGAKNNDLNPTPNLSVHHPCSRTATTCAATTSAATTSATTTSAVASVPRI